MLDIVAFSNAMRQGAVSFLQPLGLRPFEDESGEIVQYRDDDAVVFPMARGSDVPEFALRLPLDDASSRQWPAHYADLVTVVGTVAAHLPAEITILDVEDLPGVDVALLYDWVPGETLTARVTRSRVRQERDQLIDLLWPLADVAEALRLAGMAHGDLAPGNIIVRPDGGMTLVDLDRMGYRDAADPMEPRRRPGYRIPRGGGDPAEEDAFALLVLMASCAILADAPVPIDHERAPEASHPTLVFSSWDLMDPVRSRLVREVESELTPISTRLLELVTDACTGSAERIPRLLREATREIRRAVSAPDGDGRDTGAAGWRTVGAAPSMHPLPHDTAPTLPVHDVVVPAAPDRTWPEPEATTAWEPPEPAEEPPQPETNAWSQDALDWQSTADLIEMLRGLADRPDGPDRPSRRARRAEARRQAVATELQEALARNDRETLVRLAMSGSLAELGESRRSDLLQVVRALSHDQIGRAVARDDDGMIVAAIDETVFERDTDLDPAFRDRVRLARARVRWTDQMVDAVKGSDADLVVALMDHPPDGAVDRLPETVRKTARQLGARHDAVRDAREFIDARDAEGLVRALGRLVTVAPVWTDHFDADVVEEFLGIEQIEHHLVRRLRDGGVPVADQWMVDMVIASGRLPDATREAGLTPTEVERRISGKL